MGPWLVVLTVVKTSAACRLEAAAPLGSGAPAPSPSPRLPAGGLEQPLPAVDAEPGVDGAIGVDVVVGLPVAVQLDAAASSDSCADLTGQDSPPQVGEPT